MSVSNESSGIVSKISGLFGLYTIFVFLSGWTFLDYYYRSFGVSTKWLDIPLTEVLTKGFVVLFQRGWLLWFIYLFVVIVPVFVEISPRFRRHLGMQTFVAILVMSCIPLTYFVAKNAGESTAIDDQSTQTTLPEISFRVGCNRYLGKLLYFRDNTYFIHD